jgi:hypothetical protein
MSSQGVDHEKRVEQMWRRYMTTGHAPRFAEFHCYHAKALKSIVRMLPMDPRCQICHFPFEGIGGTLAKSLLGVERAKLATNWAPEHPGFRIQDQKETRISWKLDLEHHSGRRAGPRGINKG